MTTQTSSEASVRSTKRRMLVASLLLAAMVVASMMAAASARASTTFVVNETGDAPDASTASSACDTDLSASGDQCTLRAAIQQANATAGADTINFAIPGTGVKTIAVNSTGGLGPLPTITEQVTIDGYTQAGAHPNTKAVGNDAALMIVLDGNNGNGSGLEIQNASGSVIKGLVINRFASAGIDMFGTTTTGTHIEGNFIGTDASGTLDKGNGSDGVSAFSQDISQTVVGGTTPAARNLISGNEGSGVALGNSFGDFGRADSIRVQGNYVGTDRSGTKDLGNRLDGIFLENTSGAMVGGKTTASRNVVSGNGFGVDLTFNSGLRMLGNRVGTTANGTGALGNDGFGVFDQGRADTGSNNSLGDGTSAGANTIAFNGGDGVNIDFGIGEEISRNSIFSNVGLGIDLRGTGEGFSTSIPTPNDLGDTDVGPNNLQNFPVLTSARTSRKGTTIKGTLNSRLGATYTIQFFSNPSGTDEGAKFIGQRSVTVDASTVDASGNVTFSFKTKKKVGVGQNITAIATNSSTGDTSEFSAPKVVAS